MHQGYEDILQLIPDVSPSWWDENGTPRFAAHHPKWCPDIYADEVLLLLISCQGCGQEFPVQMSWSINDVMLAKLGQGTLGAVAADLDDAIARLHRDAPFTKALIAKREARRARDYDLLADQVRQGSIHYGDPPFAGCCPAGVTMSCWDLRVLEFWARGFTLRRILEPTYSGDTMTGDELSKYDWRRVPDLEIELPDAKEPERLRRP